jgi:hypothetical protein
LPLSSSFMLDMNAVQTMSSDTYFRAGRVAASTK